MELGFKTCQSPATRISLAEGPLCCRTIWECVYRQTPALLHTVDGTYPTCQNNKEPSDPPLAKSPSWTGCQATAANQKYRERLNDYNMWWLQEESLKRETHPSHRPVASFLWPRNTWSSSFRFRISKSLQRWSRDAVRSQLPLRFNFTSITVFLWAWLETKHREYSTSGHKATSLHQHGPFCWKHVDNDGERCGLVVIEYVTITR